MSIYTCTYLSVCMSTYLAKLKRCQSITDFINEFKLKLTSAQFGYIVYQLKDENKYHSFTIPKKSGGKRTIYAPNNSLKYLQKELSAILLGCINEIKADTPRYLTCNHAFERDKSIVSNADIHKKKKHVVNIDIQDFFSSIHYGRIKGFLKKDTHFSLHEKISQIIAKLATFEGKLPQGAPSSPILASLIGNIIDTRFLKLAKKYKFTYSRYADDITLSSNTPFSQAIIYWDNQECRWIAGSAITSLLEKSGFSINPSKTHYMKNSGRQAITGIVVNKKRNTTIQYRKINRAMTYSLLSKGKFKYTLRSGEIIDGHINQLIGRITHSIYVKYYALHSPESLSANSNREVIKRKKREALTKIINSHWDKKKSYDINADHQMLLLRNVLFYKYVINIEKTTIIPEGYTDPLYFKAAYTSLNKKESIIFQQINNSLKKIGILGGASSVNSFICHIKEKKEGFVSHHMFSVTPKHPLIFTLDYDDGLDDCGFILNNVKDGRNFQYLCKNIYVLFLTTKDRKNHKKPDNQVYIENLIQFQGEKVKACTENKEYINFKDTKIKKYHFAKYVYENAEQFNFSSFHSLFNAIKEIEKDYAKRLEKEDIY